MFKKTYRFEVEYVDANDDVMSGILPYIMTPFITQKIFFVSALSKEEAIKLLHHYFMDTEQTIQIIEPNDDYIPKQYQNLEYKTVLYWKNARTLIFRKDQP